ncbi:hypothetical protein ACOSP7_013308 [Xanthoceras sorbifolium]
MAEISPSPTSLNSTLNCHDHQDLSHQHQLASSLDFNIMVIMAAMLCALVCALGLHSMLQGVFQCTHCALTEPREWVASWRLNSGLKKKEIMVLPTTTFSGSSSSASSSSSPGCCAICLGDFVDGEEVRVLPKCNHKFHVTCIDKWLLSHPSCPTCRQSLKSNDSMPSLDQIITVL